MKHQIVPTLRKYRPNPPIKLALVMGRPLPGYALRQATKTSLTLWKNADADIPILKQAKAEYANLQ